MICGSKNKFTAIVTHKYSTIAVKKIIRGLLLVVERQPELIPVHFFFWLLVLLLRPYSNRRQFPCESLSGHTMIERKN
jgi:hypothetical protein